MSAATEAGIETILIKLPQGWVRLHLVDVDGELVELVEPPELAGALTQAVADHLRQERRP